MKLRRNAKVDLLRSGALFPGCSQKELGQISALADEIASRKARPDPGRIQRAGVLRSHRGTVEVRCKGASLRTLRGGEFFGEIALLTETPRSATSWHDARSGCS